MLSAARKKVMLTLPVPPKALDRWCPTCDRFTACQGVRLIVDLYRTHGFLLLMPPQRSEVRLSLSCVECKRRKIRCDGRLPCSSCDSRGMARSCQKYRPQRVRKAKGYGESSTGSIVAHSRSDMLDGGDGPLPATFLQSLPSHCRFVHIFGVLKSARQLSQGNLLLNTDEIQAVADRVYLSSSPDAISPAEAFVFSCGLLFASAISGAEPKEEFEALYESNAELRRQILLSPSPSSCRSVLLGSWMVGMVMVWSARTDDAVDVVQAGMCSAVTLGVHHASILATYDKEERGFLLDAFLHTTSQACLFHGLSGFQLPLYPTQLDIPSLLALCQDTSAAPSQAMISRAEMHIKAWQTIERFYRSKDGTYVPAPSKSELIGLSYSRASSLSSSNEEQREYSRVVRLTAEIAAIVKEGTKQQRQHGSDDQGRSKRILGGAISAKGNAKLMLLLMRFLQVLVNYPYSYSHDDARNVVCSVSRSIFGSAWNLASSSDPASSSSSSSNSVDMEGTNELYVLVSLRCLLLLEQYNSSPSQDGAIDDVQERLAVDTAFGKQAVTNLSHTLRMDSSALRECQRLLFHADRGRIATFET